MKSIIKKASALVLATALLGTSISGTPFVLNNDLGSQATLSASAASFITSRDYSGIKFDESQITVTMTKSQKTKTVYTPKINNKVISYQGIRCIPLTKAQITVNVQGKNLSSSSLNSTTITVESKIGTKKNQQTYKCSKITAKSNNSFDLVYDVMTQGTEINITTSPINNLTSAGSITYESNEPYNYYFIEATAPGADRLYIKFRNTGTSQTYISNWAKRLCMYANSLSDITGMKLDTLYICFDDFANTYGCPFSCNARFNPSCDKYGYVSMPTSFTADELNNINTGISWTLLHEIAHSYCVYVDSSKFWKNCVPVYPKGGYQDDDFFTNLRGLTAIQNCYNLRNTTIWIRNSGTIKKGKYTEIAYQVATPGNEDWTNSEWLYYTFVKKLLNTTKSDYDWKVLKSVFAVKKLDGSAAADYSYTSTENINTLKWINKWLNKSYPTSTNYTDLLRMTNFLRRLYKVQRGEQLNETDFISFLDNQFSKSYIQNVYSYMYTSQHGH